MRVTQANHVIGSLRKVCTIPTLREYCSDKQIETVQRELTNKMAGTQGSSAIPPPSYNDIADDEKRQAAQQAVQPQPGVTGYPPIQPQPQYYAGQQPVQPVPGYVYPQQPAIIQGGIQPVQQVQYMVPPAVAAPQIGVMQKPSYGAPHTFFVITIVVMVICAILNITSLAFGVPALIVAIMAQSSISSGDYPTASSRGLTAMVLTIVNVGYTLGWAVIIIGSTVGPYCVASYYYCGY